MMVLHHVKKKGVGTIIGAAFVVLIIFSWYTFFQLTLHDQMEYAEALSTMQERDSRQSSESLDILGVEIASGNLLNLTIQNTGSDQTHIVWLGILDRKLDTFQTYKVDYYVDPSGTDDGSHGTSSGSESST